MAQVGWEDEVGEVAGFYNWMIVFTFYSKNQEVVGQSVILVPLDGGLEVTGRIR